MARKNKGEPVSPMAFMFAELWDACVENIDLDNERIMDLLALTGFAVWRDATVADVKSPRHDGLEVGDPILCLTDAGQAIVDTGRKTK